MILAGDLLPTDVGATVALTRFSIRGRLDALEVPRFGMVPLTVDAVDLLVEEDELVAIDRGDSPTSPTVRAADFDARAHSLLSSLARKAHA